MDGVVGGWVVSGWGGRRVGGEWSGKRSSFF